MFKDSLGKLTRGESLSDAETTEFIENMRDDVVNEFRDAAHCRDLIGGEPGKAGKLDAGRHEFRVRGRPRNAVGVMLSRHRVLPPACRWP